jgi:FkbM family methyltransferase
VRTIAIEPQPEMLRRLYFNIEANGMAEQISVIEKAVCESIGETEFLVSTSNRGTSGLKSAQGQTQSLTVATTTLASVILDSGWSHVDAIKLDIEGAEDQALPPLFDLRSSLWPRLILMETRARNWEVDLAGLLADKGYRISLQAKGNAVWVRK